MSRLKMINIKFNDLQTVGGNVKGHGIDLVNIAEFSQLISGINQKCLERYFTHGELETVGHGVNRMEKLAGRFAVKEAVMKALGVGWGNGVAFTDVEVINKDTGAPFVQLKRKLAELANERGITRWYISTSHIGSIAVASAIGVDDT